MKEKTDTAVSHPLPVAGPETGLDALKSLIKSRSLLPSLEIMHRDVGDAFQITLPVFKPAVFAGPKANRQLLVTDRDKLLSKNEQDPVAKLLREGVLVADGECHEMLRREMDPILHRRNVLPHTADFWRYTAEITNTWENGRTYNMLVEMRKVALLILMGTLFKVDFGPDLERMWRPILRAIDYISPGLWIIFPNLPRPQYNKALAELDEYLYDIIQRRRAEINCADDPIEAGDLLGHLIKVGMDDGLIRDQLLTMLIAGHDTSTALLAWTLYLLGRHPDAMNRVKEELDSVLQGAQPDSDSVNQLAYLDMVIKEVLRLYPPIHIGNRRASEDMTINGYEVQEGMRVMYSIYLSHRDSKQWAEPNRFLPERFDRNSKAKQPAFTYLPFGGGPRNCIGAAFAQVEVKVALAQILQTFELTLVEDKVRPYMGATLEPRPGVMMQVRRR